LGLTILPYALAELIGFEGHSASLLQLGVASNAGFGVHYSLGIWAGREKAEEMVETRARSRFFEKGHYGKSFKDQELNWEEVSLSVIHL